jgi:hypothetical protein
MVSMSVAKAARAAALTLALATTGMMSNASAVEQALMGAWIQDRAQCDEVFTRTEKSVSFKKPIKEFVQSFIISGSQIQTPQASCRIKAMKRSGDRRILDLTCTTSVAVNEMPVILAPSADGTLRRFLNAEDTIGSIYKRCSL